MIGALKWIAYLALAQLVMLGIYAGTSFWSEDPIIPTLWGAISAVIVWQIRRDTEGK